MRKKYIRRPGGFEAEPYSPGMENGCLNEAICSHFKNGGCVADCTLLRPYVNTEHKGRCPVGEESMLVYGGDKVVLVVNKKQFDKMFEEAPVPTECGCNQV